MTFKAEEHFRQLKGQNYLDCVWRVVWVREEHPDAQIDTEVVYWDHDKQEIMMRAVVVLPKTGARATGHCVGTLAEFKFGYVEKCETQAVGRALALLGYGTAFAGADLDEGERVADSPTAARNGAGASAPAVGPQAAVRPATATPRAGAGAVTAPVPAPNAKRQTPNADGEEWPRSAAEWTRAQLRQRIQEGAGFDLKSGKEWKALAHSHGQPDVASSAEMTQAWLLGLYQAMRAQEYQEMIAMATTEEQVTELLSEALGERDRRGITSAAYSALCQGAEARKAELSAPLLSGTPTRAQVAS